MDAWREVLQEILNMTFVGSVVTLALFGLKPLISSKISKTAQYRLWLVPIAAFLIPILVFIVAPSDLDYAIWFSDASDSKLDLYATWILIGGTALAVFAIFLTGLRRGVIFRRKYKLIVKCRRVSLFVNPKNKYPFLAFQAGVFRPVIVLNNGGVFNAFQREFILRHELTHLRRKDVLLRSFTLFAAVINWFNPLAWLMAAEMSKACELACDESVMRDIEKRGRQLHRERFNPEPADLATLGDSFVALCEEKRNLKEWLDAIAADKNHTQKVAFIALALVAAAALAMLALGALSSVL
ncbi:MAG: M56 family metallopeptidase [Clostridiales bacterium]|jgi:beta-lactamase regulating signal transducer with metallopeptidase domain|nr:M56 family metallopeptidase [Clostridiales bacterium]